MDEPKIGDKVEIKGEDSYFKGEIRSIFTKVSGKVRYVVENPDGVLHIYNIKQLKFNTTTSD